MMRRAPLKAGTKGLKRTAFAPAAKTGMLSVFAAQRTRKAAPARKARLKAKQRAVSADEKLLWDRLATEIGCVACMLDHRRNTHVSIHHVDGRTKPGCHKLVLPLCAPHHQQDDTDPLQRIAVHPNKARFEARYGSQAELMVICAQILNELRPAPAPAATSNQFTE
jgi:hypothetical protein